MIEHPPVPDRRELHGDLLDIRDELLRKIVRLDRLGESPTANRLIEAVEALVEVPMASEQTAEEVEQMARDQERYEENIQNTRFGNWGEPTKKLPMLFHVLHSMMNARKARWRSKCRAES